MLLQFDFNLQPANKTCARQVKNEQENSSLIDHNRPILQRLNKQDNMLSSHPIEKQKQVNSKACFVLPDLNMLPSEDETVLLETLSWEKETNSICLIQINPSLFMELANISLGAYW